MNMQTMFENRTDKLIRFCWTAHCVTFLVAAASSPRQCTKNERVFEALRTSWHYTVRHDSHHMIEIVLVQVVLVNTFKL